MNPLTHHPTTGRIHAQAQGSQKGLQLPRLQAGQAQAPPPALPVKTLVATVVLAATVAFGDAAVAAAIAGIFSVVNTVMGVWLVRRVEHTRRTLGAPRRAIRDDDGNLLGTVIDLEDPTNGAPKRRLADHGPHHL